jgi:hypothetical protein
MSVIDYVKDKLGFATDSELTRFLGIDRSCVWDWRQRLDGGIPSRHWITLVDEAKKRRKKLTMEDLRG